MKRELCQNTGIILGIFIHFPGLVNVYKKRCKITIFTGKINYKWPFSIAMLVYHPLRCPNFFPDCSSPEPTKIGQPPRKRWVSQHTIEAYRGNMQMFRVQHDAPQSLAEDREPQPVPCARSFFFQTRPAQNSLTFGAVRRWSPNL